MLAIYRREIGAFFTSGIAYVFLAVFWLVSGIFFYNGVIASGTTDTSAMFSSMFYIVMFLIPVLTMKLLSEEKKNKTDQGLLTAPIGLWSIVLGKYFAALTLFVIAESVIFIYSLILAYLGDVVWPSLLGNYFAMLFLGAAFIAVGLFISSLTENQIVAAVGTYLIIFIMWYSYGFGASVQNQSLLTLLNRISLMNLYYELVMGVLNPGSIVTMISVTAVFLFLTCISAGSRRK